jgi:hypothetical protein
MKSKGKRALVPPKGTANGSAINTSMTNMFSYLHNHIHALNNSKLFAGLMIITLNIASKFVTVKLSKSMEAYLKYTFSRQILIFTIAWMGTRDIYIALIVSLVFMLCMDFLFNEESMFCCLPADFTDYHVQLFDTNQTNNPTGQGQVQPSNGQTMAKSSESDVVTEEEIQKAKAVLDKAKQQNGQLQYQSFYKT